ncbi:MAG: TonB-dependent receptor [Flavobacteriales bacterium]|nr:TonB-dependent receptor [Flavobacteriales bacterium]
MRNGLIFPFVFCVSIAVSQQQRIYGEVLENFTEKPVPNVHITLLKRSESVLQTVTDSLGKFVFTEVEVGQYEISFSHLSYVPFTLPSVEVTASKPTVINSSLDFSYVQMKELEILPEKDKGTANNKMALLSSFSIDADDSRKLAGSLDDPARVVGLLPGVISYTGFSANFISIRGNSPRGFKYQMEGVELPNPTHFARIGSSGGTFTIFSMQIMGKSDFFSGAFPAEYGNATAGVLDVKFREGSTQEYSHMFKIGTLGIDIATEGPINKKKGSSYLVNYRYAVVGLARLIGYPTQPTYSDLSFNLNFPVSEKGSFNVFGLAGMSDRARIPVTDSTKWEQDLDRYQLNLGSKMATVGVNYKTLVGKSSVFSSTLLAGVIDQFDNKDYLLSDLSLQMKEINEYESVPITFAASLKHKFGKYHSNKTGASVNYSTHNWRAIKRNYFSNQLDTLVFGSGNSMTIKAFTNSNFNLSEKWIVNIGIHSIYYNVNNDSKLEPRAAIQYQVNEKNKVSIAYGRHSQADHFATYLYRTKDPFGNVIYPNKDLKLITANHFIVGYKSNLFKNHRLSIEVYYQTLTDVPVEVGGAFSTINLNELDDMRKLENEGTGINYGVDFGIERFSENGLYYIINSSFVRSFYTTGDNVIRSTEYDLGYTVKFLLGKEFEVGKGKHNYFGWNTNFSVIGGQPYTPINIEESRLAQETILDERIAYSERDNPLVFLDLTVTYKTNKKKRSTLWSLQLKNIFSNGNAIYREYDSVLDEEVTIPSSSFFPNISYRLEF